MQLRSLLPPRNIALHRLPSPASLRVITKLIAEIINTINVIAIPIAAAYPYLLFKKAWLYRNKVRVKNCLVEPPSAANCCGSAKTYKPPIVPTIKTKVMVFFKDGRVTNLNCCHFVAPSTDADS